MSEVNDEQEMFLRRVPAALASCKNQYDLVRFNEIQLGNCLGFSEPCGKPGKLRRQNTAYHVEIRNWNCLCDLCQEEADLYWAEMWAEYRSSQGV